MLSQRAELIRSIRAFFDRRGFLEVETPILSLDTVVDRHIDPIAVSASALGFNVASNEKLWLQTSPEFAMKRMMASGAKAIYQIARVFRASEYGATHNPEFTMLEWYRAGDNQQTGIELLASFAKEFLNNSETTLITYSDAFEQHVELHPFLAAIEEFARTAQLLSIPLPWSADNRDRDDWLNLLFSELVQPNLGGPNPQIVFDYPASQSALAVIREEKFPVAERFELFYQGAELANGYHELTDAEELENRNALVNQQRIADGNSPLPEQSRMLEAMKIGLPACAGVALGVDRLLMAITGAEQISEVIAFPIDRA